MTRMDKELLLALAVCLLGLAMLLLPLDSPAEEGLILPLASKHHREHPRVQFNERNYGLGYENKDGYFGLVFKDSFSKTAAAVGKAYRWNYPLTDQISVTGNLYAFVMTKYNFSKRVYFPAVLPSIGLRYGNVSLEYTYLPEFKFNSYATSFIMLRIAF